MTLANHLTLSGVGPEMVQPPLMILSFRNRRVRQLPIGED